MDPLGLGSFILKYFETTNLTSFFAIYFTFPFFWPPKTMKNDVVYGVMTWNACLIS